MAYRHTAVFHADWRTHCRALDRNQKVRILVAVEGLERRTKAPGCRNGIISVIGVIVLRALLYRFHNASSGLCCPSYRAIQDHTGLCKQSIATAIAKLETAGVLSIVRRLCRQTIRRISPWTNLPEDIMTTTQATSLYRLQMPGAWSTALARPCHKPAPFPSRRQLDLLQAMGKLWESRLRLTEQSTTGRKKHTTPVQSIARLMRG